MAKQVYELAAELGMRSERLVQLLKQEGFHIESALDPLDAQAAAEIRRDLEASRSRWSRLKTLLRRRLGVSRLPSTATLSEQEEEELEELVSRQEEQDQPVPVALELDEELEPAQDARPAEVLEPTPPETTAPPAKVAGLSEVESREPAFAEEELPSGQETEPLGEESLLATLDRIAQMEEPDEPSVDESISAEALLEEQLGTFDEGEAQEPVAAATPAEEKRPGVPSPPAQVVT